MISKNRTKPRLLVVYGTRPEVIKLWPLLHFLNEDERFEWPILVANLEQQPALIKQTERALGLQTVVGGELPIYANIKTRPARLGGKEADTGREVLDRAFDSILWFDPDLVIVQGDTASAFAAATMAYYRGIPIAHIEAGLSTGDIFSPYPEEFNRRVIDLIADLCFTIQPDYIPPNKLQSKHARWYSVGNTITDALRLMEAQNKIQEPTMPGSWQKAELKAVVTLHRRENTDDPDLGQEILDGIAEGLQVAGAEHGYGSTSGVLIDHFRNHNLEAWGPLFRCEPMDYPHFLGLLRQADLIITDSGGLQEEASWFHIPTLVVRDTTERMALVEHGGAVLIPPSMGYPGSAGLMTGMEAIAQRVLDNASPNRLNEMRKAPPTYLFGDGFASQAIIEVIADYLGA